MGERLSTRGRSCEGRDHEAGLYGHSGPARYLVHVSCPFCEYGYTKALCTGRVMAGMNGPGLVCDNCRHADSALAFWTLEELPEEEPTASAALEKWVDPLPVAVSSERSPEGWLATWELRMMAQNCTPKTIRERLVVVRAFLRTLEDQELREVTQHDLLRFLARPDLKPRSRATYRSTLASFFRFLVDEGLLEHDPAARLPRVRVRTAEPDPIRTLEMQQLLNSGIYGHTVTKVLLYAYEGLRASEIAAIKGEDVDWEQGRLWVANAKGGRPVWRPMHALVREHVMEQGYPRAGYWFPSPTGEHVSGRSVSDTISKAMKRAGIAHRPHDLRKWHGTTLIALGADSLDVQHSLRHVDGQSMKAYVLPNEPRIIAAKEQLPRVTLPRRGESRPAVGDGA